MNVPYILTFEWVPTIDHTSRCDTRVSIYLLEVGIYLLQLGLNVIFVHHRNAQTLSRDLSLDKSADLFVHAILTLLTESWVRLEVL